MKKSLYFPALALALLLCLLAFFSACDQTEGTGATPTDAPTSVPTEVPTETPTEPPLVEISYQWTLDDLGPNVNTHTEQQKAYLSGKYDAIGDYADGKSELSRPLPITLTWSAVPGNDEQPSVTEYEVELSSYSDFSDAQVFKCTENTLNVYNLYISKIYYWRVTAQLSDGQSTTSEIKAFGTSDACPRNLYVDGITNVRDLGGWMTADGKRVKQGMIYRAGRLNESGAETLVVEITESGIAMLRDTLGVKTELDLRRGDNGETGGITESPLGAGVAYVHKPMDWDVDNMIKDNIEKVKEVFALLADESNYPIVYHCNIGTDRTGMFAFLINALLGVSEEDLYRDYLFSNFGLINGTRGATNLRRTHLRTVGAYEGATLSEKTRNCLLDLGIPAEHLDAIVRIMLED